MKTFKEKINKRNYLILKNSFGRSTFSIHDVFNLLYPNKELSQNAIRLLILKHSLKRMVERKYLFETFPNEFKIKW